MWRDPLSSYRQVIVRLRIATILAAVIIPIFAFQTSQAAEVVDGTGVHVKPLVAVDGQSDPSELWDPNRLPQVAAAAHNVTRNAALPRAIVPSMATLEQENTSISYGIPAGCDPGFGPVTTSNLCPLGDTSSTRVVAVFGDSHAQMWTPALIEAGEAQGFAVVPIVKPGCLLNFLNSGLPGWPCGIWYQWALQQLKTLNPIATIVSFKIGNSLLHNASLTITDLRQVMTSVPNPIYLSASPDVLPKPAECLIKPGATMRTCSAAESRLYPTVMRDIANMAYQLHDAALPTIQWFCANRICPMIIEHTLVTRDGDHLTMEYSADLGPFLGQELQPILDKRAQAPTLP